MKRVVSVLVILTLVCTVLVSITHSSVAAGAKTPFDRTNLPAQMRVTASALNVRSGPATYFKKVGIVYKNQIVSCLGRLGNWYVVHLNNDTVGVASGKYLKPYYPPTNQPAPTPKPGTPTGEVSEEAQRMLNLINAERAKAGAQPLKFDKEVMRVAQIKAQDMVDQNYFSHNSPIYGSPFNMLNSFKVSYRTAGENLAGNRSVEAAHNSLMNSQGHRRNILNKGFNLIGIGIVNSPKYGKIYVQMFIGR
ncbi:MAG: CAP domain-containing protein [Firmicutes bacterium]|nr:CAP domain-containing protein [Bacillota bacterium]